MPSLVASAAPGPIGTAMQSSGRALAEAVAAAAPPGGAAAAAAAVRAPHELARVRRDMEFHTRHDMLVDTRQQVLNEVTFLLRHR